MAVSKSWCIEGTQELADAVLKDSATPEDLEILLFSNDPTITKDTTDTDLTEITTNGGEKRFNESDMERRHGCRPGCQRL